MSLTKISRIGKKRVLVIPKAIADQVGLMERSRVKITSSGWKIIIEPILDAI
jgi:AbrB family looped-hinge helix DNA binding protein